MIDPGTLSAAYNPGNLSRQQVIDLINVKTGQSVITPRLQLLDRNLQPVPTGTIGPTGDPADMTDLLQSLKIDINTQQAVQRTCDITMREPTRFDLDSLRHRIKVFIDYWDPATKQLLLEIPAGVFRAVLPTRTLTSAGIMQQMVMQDLTFNLGRLGFINPYTVPAGITFTQAMTNLLTMDYLPLSKGGQGQTPTGDDDAGPGASLSRITIPRDDRIVQSPIPFTRDITKQAALNQLAASINFYPLLADPVGGYTTWPMPYYTNSIPAPAWTYSTDGTSTIVPDSITETFNNAAQLANVAIVLVEPSGAPSFGATAYNMSAASRISITNLQEAIFLLPIIKDPTIPDAASARLRALIALQEAAVVAETIQFSAAPNALLQPHDMLLLNVTTADGQVHVTSSANNPWEITAITFDFSQPGGGAMTITAGKVVAV
jgi:hypothetical protein